MQLWMRDEEEYEDATLDIILAGLVFFHAPDEETEAQTFYAVPISEIAAYEFEGEWEAKAFREALSGPWVLAAGN